MTLAAAPRFDAPLAEPIPAELETEDGAHSLLHLPAPPPHHSARIGAVVVYLALIGAMLTIGFHANDAPVEEIQVVEMAPPPAEEEPPPDDIPETLQLDELPPPPPALQPIAPVEQKPIEKPKPLKKVEHKPTHEPRPAAERSNRSDHPAAVGPRANAEAKPNANASLIANALHACLQRAAASVDAPRSGRVSYHASISASGSVSVSVSPSGNAVLDGLANRIAGRCTSVPAPGAPKSLSGAISFSGP